MKISTLILLLIHFTLLRSQDLFKKIDLSQAAYGIALSDENRLVFVAGKDSTGTVWTSKGQLLTTFKGHQSSVSSISFNEENSTVLTGSYDNSAMLWDLSGKVLARLEGHENAVINVDQSGELLATASRDKTATIWDRGGQRISKLEGHSQQVNVIKILEEKGWVVTGSFDETVKIWDFEGRLLETFTPHNSGIRSLEVSLEKELIIAGHRDGFISIMDLEGNFLKKFEGHSGPYAMVNDIQILNSDLNFITSGADGYIRIWDFDGTLVKEFKATEGENAYVSGFSYADGILVSSHGVDNSIKIWDLSPIPLRNYPCASPNYTFLRQLIGSWSVSTRDRTSPGIYEENLGAATISSAIEGCGVSISFRGSFKGKPYARESILTSLDSTLVQMVAMDSDHGRFSTYDGSISDGQLVLYWFRDKEKKRLQSKYVMTINNKNQFEFSSYLSTDYGETWSLTHERIYSKSMTD